MANKNDLNEIYRILGNLEAGQASILDRLEAIESNHKPVQEGAWENAFNKNLARVGLVMTAIAAALVTMGNVIVQIIKELK